MRGSLLNSSVRRNQSPSFATGTLMITSFLECASLIAVTRAAGQWTVLLLVPSMMRLEE